MSTKQDKFIFPSVDIAGNPMCVAPINQVTPNIFIGDHNAASSESILLNYGITHIVNCAGEIPSYFKGKGIRGVGKRQDLTYLSLNLEDKAEELLSKASKAYDFIIEAFNSTNAKVLVHCHMGMSRSASIVIYYLMKSRGYNYKNALRILKAVRHIVRPNSSYAMQLSKDDKKPVVKQRNTRGVISMTIPDDLKDFRSPSDDIEDILIKNMRSPYEKREDGLIYYKY